MLRLFRCHESLSCYKRANIEVKVQVLSDFLALAIPRGVLTNRKRGDYSSHSLLFPSPHVMGKPNTIVTRIIQ